MCHCSRSLVISMIIWFCFILFILSLYYAYTILHDLTFCHAVHRIGNATNWNRTINKVCSILFRLCVQAKFSLLTFRVTDQVKSFKAKTIITGTEFQKEIRSKSSTSLYCWALMAFFVTPLLELFVAAFLSMLGFVAMFAGFAFLVMVTCNAINAIRSSVIFKLLYIFFGQQNEYSYVHRTYPPHDDHDVPSFRRPFCRPSSLHDGWNHKF